MVSSDKAIPYRDVRVILNVRIRRSYEAMTMANTTRKASESRQATPTPKGNPEVSSKDATEGAPKDDTRALEHIQKDQAGLDHPAAAKAATEGSNPVTATAAAMAEQQKQDATEDRGVGDNEAPDADEIMDQIIRETYQPHIVGEVNIATELREVLAQTQSLSNEIEGTATSRGANAMADLIADIMKRPNPPVKFGAGCDKALVDYIKQNELLGKVADFLVKDDTVRKLQKKYDVETKETSREAVATNNVIDMSPYRDPRLVLWSRSGWLVAIGEVSKVAFGYARKNEYSGRRWERHNVMLSLGETENGEDLTIYHRVISVPLNVVHPFMREEVTDKKDNTIRYMIEGQPEDDTRLRPLMADWRDGLFSFYSQYHNAPSMPEFGKQLPECENWFDTNLVTRRKNYAPSGYLLKSPQIAPRANNKRNDKGEHADDDRPHTTEQWSALSAAEKEVEFKKLTEEKKLAASVSLGDPKSEKFAETLNVIATALADERVLSTMHSSAIANVLRGAFHVLRYASVRWFGNGEVPPIDIMRELAPIQNLGIFGTPNGTMSYIVEKEDGSLVAYNNENKEIGPLMSADGKFINGKMMRTEGPKAA